jgi:hypothetical protein
MTTYRFDPVAGIVFGKMGRPIRKTGGSGYIEVNSGGKLVGLAHRMLWESANGPIPTGLTINHINGIKTDNRLENLECVSMAENIRHAFRTGLICTSGEKSGRSRLCESAVRFIRFSSQSGASLAARYGVARTTIARVRRGETWKHLAGEP